MAKYTIIKNEIYYIDSLRVYEDQLPQLPDEIDVPKFVIMRAIKAFLNKGEKIEAIKLAKDTFHFGLLEAKNFIESDEVQNYDVYQDISYRAFEIEKEKARNKYDDLDT